MIRTLFIVAGGALVLCLACIGGAAALGGRDLSAHDWTWVISEDNHGNRTHFERGAPSPDVSRAIAWTGGKTLTVDLPVDVAYVQGAEAGVVVKGPADLVNRVRLVDGRLTLEDNDNEDRLYIHRTHGGFDISSQTDRLRVVVTAPDVDSFRVAASGDLTIEAYDKPSIDLLIDGSGDVDASGHAASVTVRQNASGDIDLAGLEVGDADIQNAGSGEIQIGPRGKAKVEISGSGDVRLTRKPTSLEQNVSGTGEIEGA